MDNAILPYFWVYFGAFRVNPTCFLFVVHCQLSIVNYYIASSRNNP